MRAWQFQPSVFSEDAVWRAIRRSFARLDETSGVTSCSESVGEVEVSFFEILARYINVLVSALARKQQTHHRHFQHLTAALALSHHVSSCLVTSIDHHKAFLDALFRVLGHRHVTR
jgi:hypothetical protein